MKNLVKSLIVVLLLGLGARWVYAVCNANNQCLAGSTASSQIYIDQNSNINFVDPFAGPFALKNVGLTNSTTQTWSGSQTLQGNLNFNTAAGVVPSTTTAIGPTLTAYLGGSTTASIGSTLCATAASGNTGATVNVCAATANLSTPVGVTAVLTSTGNIVSYYTAGAYATALTSGTVSTGDLLTTSSGSAGYLSANNVAVATNTVVGVAMQTGTSAGGLTLIRVR